MLTNHFGLPEFIASSTAEAHGIDNTPSQEIVTSLVQLAEGLEQVRTLLGDNPIHINSGYRCEALNSAVGGVSDSAHLSGFAADIVCPQFGTPLQIVEAISTSSIKFDQCITEGTWTHISFAPAMRRETLTAHFDADGKATYSQGVA